MAFLLGSFAPYQKGTKIGVVPRGAKLQLLISY